MRAVLAFAALALGSLRAPAQARPAQAVPAAAQTNDTSDTTRVAQEIAQRRAAGDQHLPDADNFSFGDRTIAANTRVDGPIAVARGNLDIYGTVDGDVVALDGNVRVHKGARVTGDAWAAGGSVIIDGGIVEGQRRAISGGRPTLPGSRTRHPLSTWESVKLVIGWFAVLTIIGLGVMVFAEGNLDGVVIALERGFARSFWLGFVGQLVMMPALFTGQSHQWPPRWLL